MPPESAAQLLDRCAFYTMPNSHILGYSVTGPNAEMERGARRYNWVWYRRIPEGELRKTLTDAQGHVHHYSLAPGQVPGSRREALVKDASHLLPPPFAAAVAAERQPFVQAIFDYEAPRMMRGRLALLGDAAFVVRPHTAMGVAKAAGDAIGAAILSRTGALCGRPARLSGRTPADRRGDCRLWAEAWSKSRLESGRDAGYRRKGCSVLDRVAADALGASPQGDAGGIEPDKTRIIRLKATVLQSVRAR